MLDLLQLTGKQRQFIELLQRQHVVESLRSLCVQAGFDFNFINGFLLSGALNSYVQWQEHTQRTWALTAKGEDLTGVLPGSLLADKLLQGQRDGGASPGGNRALLQAELGAAFSLHYGALRREQAVDLIDGDGEGTVAVLKSSVLGAFQQRQGVFEAIAAGKSLDASASSSLEWLQQQGYIVSRVETDYSLTVLPALQTLDLGDVVTTLTSELILSGQWRQADLKPYDIQAEVPDVAYGRPTILTQCIQRIRDIFLNMGFDEMSGYMVESAFWNFDALFTPQDHPAREVQDTFYLANPQTLPLPDDPVLVQRVKQVHEANYGGQWTEAEASRAILRAHTTTSTARRLHQLQGKDGKYFSIDRVFRNETVDRTHLAEFHQIEGVVVGELLSVRTLMGYLTYFYERLGFKDLKFKPTYNPYTEPSLEVFAYHPPSDRYIEVGNSGLFRQEMLAPLGCGEKATVAWGLGLERIAMLLYGVEKLSDLIGPDIQL
ncbi:phenylalanine--tRNA ligase subunit alpha [Phormidium tenue]|uniref:phenylalanine--tRNA ligase n=1 Tax=Phormidium tenue NIES-30 TaxID=549789 RepID=A0A1U7J1Q8_9CYAN|nr:phenylalanine--tRNA ligase subunit alpha [Phormidium tenue]MBD2232160.1 phenylalanine--tRNA ligase subunit alpha [Phormidium tenue FACHB-1052]OKH45893.1 phenylalanine--tRNA ligase subunit alpha [Phormidium tenue NIES-30]